MILIVKKIKNRFLIPPIYALLKTGKSGIAIELEIKKS